jgi:ABC-type nitrate/sulfonate/bicarbonate transport system permease component
VTAASSPGPGNASARPRAGWRWGRLLSPPVISIAGFIGIWWLASLGQPQHILPSPAAVLASIWEISVGTGELWTALRISLVSLLIGGGLALLIGVPVGVLMGAQRTVERALDMYVVGLYVAPVSALTPLFIFWLGIDLAPRVATVFIFAVPQIIITCFRGARSTPRTHIEVAHAFRASRRDVFTKVVIPHEIPYIVTAVRLGLGQAIKGMVLAELIVSTTGLGLLLNTYAQLFDTASLIAVVLVLMLLGVLGTALIARVETAITPWRRQA